MAEDHFDRQFYAWIIGMLLVTAVFLAIFAAYPRYRALAICDEAVQAELKAPATYVRVKPSYWDADVGAGSIPMTYDAQNSFGVPVRGSGRCSLSYDRNSATWWDDRAMGIK